MELSEFAPEIFDVVNDDGINVDLKGLAFLDHDFSHRQIGKIDFDQSKFIYVNMRNSNLCETKFERCEFYAVDFGGAQISPIKNKNLFSKINYRKGDNFFVQTDGDELLNKFADSRFKHVNFGSSSIEEMNFRFLEFEDCNFSLASAKATDFKDCIMRQCIFNHANFSMSNFAGVLLGRNKFINSNLLFASFAGTRNACVSFNGANCRNTNWMGSKHILTNFSNADLRSSDFENAEFVYCDFTNSDMRGVKFENTVIRKCKWDGVDFEHDGPPLEWLRFLFDKKKIHIAEDELET